MDEVAVSHSTEEDLKDLGLSERGHIISLKGYCLLQNNALGTQSNKAHLKSFIKDAGKERDSKKRKTVQDVTVSLGWMNYDKKKERYVSIRMQKGGGTRKVVLAKSVTVDEIIKSAKKLFFPEEKSIFGGTNKMIFNLGNYAGVVIDSSGFDLGTYIAENKLSKPRVYLMSKLKTWQEYVNNDLPSEDEDFDIKFIPSGRKYILANINCNINHNINFVVHSYRL